MKRLNNGSKWVRVKTDNVFVQFDLERYQLKMFKLVIDNLRQ